MTKISSLNLLHFFCLNRAIRHDEELNKLCQHITISEGGVVPMIHSVLLPKKTATKQPNLE
jgi:histone H2A